MPFEFTDVEQKKIAEMVLRYPEKRAALIPVLYLAQNRNGYVSADVVRAVAKALALTPAVVFEVVTFYHMFHQAPVGRHHVQICTNIACMLRGAEELVDVARRHCGVEPGETSADGRFTVEEVECLAACGTAPAVQVNEEYHEQVTCDGFATLLDKMT